MADHKTGKQVLILPLTDHHIENVEPSSECLFAGSIFLIFVFLKSVNLN